MSTEYMPTTEEVRERYIDGFPIDTWAVAREGCGTDFDRWLAAHDAVVRREQAETDAQLAEGLMIGRPGKQRHAAWDVIAEEIRAEYLTGERDEGSGLNREGGHES